MSHRDSLDHSEHSIINRLTGALSLITLGIFLLLNSMGVVPWSAWGTVFLVFLRIWPIFIIIAGFQIIFGKHSIVSSILSVISTLVFVFLLAFSAVVNLTDPVLRSELEKNIPIFVNFNIQNNQKYVAKDISLNDEKFKLEQVRQRELNFSFTSEKYSITADKEDKNYLALHANYIQDTTTPYLESDLSQNTITINSGARENSTQNIINLINNSDYKYTIGFVEVPTDINLNMTSGEGTLNLANLNLNNLTLNQTSGEITADLLNSNVKKVYVQMTSGDSTINLPSTAHLKITYSKTSGNVNINGKTQDKTLDTVSAGDETSDYVIELFVQITSGNIKINTK